MRVFIADRVKEDIEIDGIISNLNLDINDIVYTQYYDKNERVHRYCYINKISNGFLFEYNEEEVISSANTFIFIWDGKDKSTRNLIKAVNNACKDCYIYRTDLKKYYKFVQERLCF